MTREEIEAQIPVKLRSLFIGGDREVVTIGSELPWLTPYGMGFVKVHDMRLNADGVVEYGIGNEQALVMAWVTGDRFPGEWPQ